MVLCNENESSYVLASLHLNVLSVLAYLLSFRSFLST